MNEIGASVAELIAAGCAPEVAARVIAGVYLAGLLSGSGRSIGRADNPGKDRVDDRVDEAAERRRAWDRAYRKRRRKGIDAGSSDVHSNPPDSQPDQPDVHPTPTDVHPTSGDVHPNPPDDAPLSLKTKNSSYNNIYNNITTNPRVEREAPRRHVHPTGVHPTQVHPTQVHPTNLHPTPGVPTRGHRLPAEWQPRDEDEATGVTLLGREAYADELAKFRDYWIAQPGQRGLKADWNATFRNWLRHARPPHGGPQPQPQRHARPLTPHQIEREKMRQVLAELDDDVARALDAGGDPGVADCPDEGEPGSLRRLPGATSGLRP